MVAALIAVAQAAQAAAAPSPPQSVAPVVVAAPAAKPTPQAARDFVYRVARPTAGHDQVARLDDPVCVRMGGFDPPYDEAVAQVIRRVATEAGGRVAGPGCDPNLIVLFTGDVPTLMQNLLKERRELLEGDSQNDAEARRFAALRRPVVWMHAITSGPWDGAPPASSGGLGDPDAVPVYEHSRASRLQSNVIDHIARVVVVIDGDKVKGLSLGQIGDYVAFAALSGADPDSHPGPDSILSLFDRPITPDGPRLRLTAWDRAYLKALYRSFSDQPGYLQQSQIAAQMRDYLGPVPATKPAAK
jgi:hypothetical protein